MFNQTEKSIAQIAEYIPRACRDMKLKEAKARLATKSHFILLMAVMPRCLMQPSLVHLTATPGRRSFLTYLHLLIIRIHHYNQSKHNHVINVMLYYIAAKCSSDYELMTNRVFRGVDWEF